MAGMLDRKQLLQEVPLAYSNIWERMKRGEFPRPRYVGKKPLWDEAEIREWFSSLPRVAQRPGGGQ